MDRTSYLAHLRADADALVAGAAGALDRDVPTCPGWTVERLVGHVGRVHRWTAGWVRSGAAPEVERAPAGPAVLDWTRQGTAELVDALESLDADAPVDTWAGMQPAVFWPRRMAIETAVHRYDRQLATGDPSPIATDLAVDGVDEMFAVVLPQRDTSGLPDAGTIHLHATDPDLGEAGEWLVTLGDEGLTVEHAHAKGDVAVRGPASDLFLLLWNRVDASGLQVFGDAGLLDRWRAAVTV